MLPRDFRQDALNGFLRFFWSGHSAAAFLIEGEGGAQVGLNLALSAGVSEECKAYDDQGGGCVGNEYVEVNHISGPKPLDGVGTRAQQRECE
ncbi:hypothetical protein COL97_10880, partial [Bacillus safensis]